MAPVRNQQLKRRIKLGLAPSMVAFYHRVSDHQPNGWTIARAEFVRHLDEMQRRGPFVDLDEVQTRVRAGENRECTFSITFDDGYADNEAFALPMLLERNIPVTYFVSTAHIENRRPFGHDVAAGVPLAVHSVAALRRWSDAGIEIGGHTRDHVDLSQATDPQTLHEQIIADKDRLEQLIGRAVRFFAFPFGLPRQLTMPAIRAVKQAGYEGFCSAFGGYNTPARDAFHIRRFHGDPEWNRMKNWLSFDRRKLDLEPEIQLPDEVCG